MIPVVNHELRYVMFYSAKVASSALRELFVGLHVPVVEGEVDRYHNLHAEFAPRPDQDYAGFFSYQVTRNPYSRLISAYLDQYVYAGLPIKVGDEASANGDKDLNFTDFIRALEQVPDAERDVHFQSQSSQASFAHISSLAQRKPDLIADVKSLGSCLKAAYSEIFQRAGRDVASELVLVQRLVSERESRNSLYYAEQSYADAAQLSPAVLRAMVAAPKAQDFYLSAEIRATVQRIYQNDFASYGYSPDSVPQAKPSADLQLIPADFDWRTYLELNPDLALAGMQSEREVVRHYLEFGRLEDIPRAYKVIAPAGFEWQKYLAKNPDLGAGGISDERAAVVHYLGFGVREGRQY
ncbi:MAG: sulfotransferase family 2 domain-containing protein [Gammaproteobacteria bacterium]|nr:sulfotransferase family 2 domain-containing protein [Gammaproteobacteria bacterium]